MRSIVLATVAGFASLSGCLAFDNGCPDGYWGSTGVAGTEKQIAENRWQAIGVTLCGFRFSVHSETGTLRLEEIDEDARGPLRRADLRFETDAVGVAVRAGNQTPVLTPHRAAGIVGPGGTEALEIGDEILFCRMDGSGQVDVDLIQTRYRAWLHDREGTTATFESLPSCT